MKTKTVSKINPYDLNSVAKNLDRSGMTKPLIARGNDPYNAGGVSKPMAQSKQEDSNLMK